MPFIEVLIGWILFAFFRDRTQWNPVLEHCRSYARVKDPVVIRAWAPAIRTVMNRSGPLTRRRPNCIHLFILISSICLGKFLIPHWKPNEFILAAFCCVGVSTDRLWPVHMMEATSCQRLLYAERTQNFTSPSIPPWLCKTCAWLSL